MPIRDHLECRWLGDKICGVDVDELFAYQTPRVVKVKDRTLGLLKHLLTLCIFIYIFVFNIWYKGAHMSMSPIEGVSRLQWQEPTNRCNPLDVECTANFDSVKDLPYCTGYTGKDPSKVVRGCDFYDARELPMSVGDGVLLPTFISKFKQSRTCPVHAKACERKWSYVNADGSVQAQKGGAKPVSETFVVDAGAFTLLIDHNFKSTRQADIACDDFKMQGHWESCNKDRTDCKPHEIKCVHSQCEEAKEMACRRVSDSNKKGISFLSSVQRQYRSLMNPKAKGMLNKHPSMTPDSAPELLDDEEQDTKDFAEALKFTAQSKTKEDHLRNVIAITDGDVLSLKTILEMAGTSLEEAWYNQKEQRHEDVRLRGVAIVISIRYENLKRWTLFKPEKPWYTITAEAMKSNMFKHATVKDMTSTSRELELGYGIYIIVKQSGQVAYFNPVFALVALTSAMALMAAANTITDLLMLMVLPRKDEYKTYKYLESRDFGEITGEENVSNDPLDPQGSKKP
jgi:hypothetical protein